MAIRNKCKAFTNKQKSCQKFSIPLSKYCIFHQDSSTILISILLGILMKFAFDYFDNMHELSQINKLEPKIEVTFIENSSDQLYVNVKSAKSNSELIKDIFFDFDIPGEFVKITREQKIDVGNSYVTPKFLHGNGWCTLAQRIEVHISSLYPNGEYGFQLNYIPTQLSDELATVENPRINPVVDLRDYPKYSLYWEYGGKTYTYEGNLDLTNLDFIQLDNSNIIRAFRGDRYREELLSHGIEVPISEYQKQFTVEWLLNMELERAGLNIDSN